MIRGVLASDPETILEVEVSDPILMRADFYVVKNEQERNDDNVRWLAMLMRQGMLLIVSGIERRYGIEKPKDENRYGRMTPTK